MNYRKVQVYAIFLYMTIPFSMAAMKHLDPAPLPVPKFSDFVITEIPQYLFENCDQAVRHRWTAEEFRKMREKAEWVTQEDVRRETTDENSFIEGCELYDWIHALNFIEKNLLRRSGHVISVEDMKNVNGCLSRLSVGNKGAFRTAHIVWAKRDIEDDTEIFALKYFAKGSEEFRARIGYIQCNDLSNIKTADIKVLLERRSKFRNVIQTQNGQRVLKLDPDKFKEWEKEAPGEREGTINMHDWWSVRYHGFPKPHLIEEYVRWCADQSKERWDPIDLAAWLWYKMVEIHAWDMSNKRTGRSLALFVLLNNGYLPPLIDSEDSNRYVSTLLNGFDDDEGYMPFIHLIKELMVKTYKLMQKELIVKTHTLIQGENRQKVRCPICGKQKNINLCSRCKKVAYCCVAHQKQDWPAHKKVCISTHS